MTIIVITHWDFEDYDKNGIPTSNKKCEFISHGIDLKTDNVVILPQEKVRNCDYIKLDKEYGWVIK